MVWGQIAGAVIGSALASRNAKKVGDQNAAFQREVGQNSLQWTVEDAEKAGVSPTLAITRNFPSVSAPYSGGTDWAGIGSDIGRAVDRARSQSERVQGKLEQLSVERAELENELLRSRIARENPLATPSFPDVTPQKGDLAGQGNVEVLPSQTSSTRKGQPDIEAGAIPDIRWVRTPQGGIAPTMSKDMTDSGGEDGWPGLMWAFRNMIIPNIAPEHYPTPPESMLPKGAKAWRWSRSAQQFMPVYQSK